MEIKALVHFRKNRLFQFLILFLIIGIVTLTGFLSIEGYFFPYPAIDTRFAPDYTEAQFEQIKLGMSEEEVLERLGPPLNNPEDSGWVYSEDDAFPFWDFAWLARGVTFDENKKVKGTTAFIAYN